MDLMTDSPGSRVALLFTPQAVTGIVKPKVNTASIHHSKVMAQVCSPVYSLLNLTHPAFEHIPPAYVRRFCIRVGE